MHEQELLKIGFIFEGPADEETIPVLVAQLLEQPIELVGLTKESSGWNDFRRPSPMDLRAGRRGPKWGMLRSYVKLLLIDQAEAVIIVVDRDSDDDFGHNDPFPHKRWCILGMNLPFEERPQLRLIDRARLDTEDLRGQLCRERSLAPDCFPDCLTDAYEAGTVPVIIGIAREMLDGWLLAQPHVVETVLWERLSEEDRMRCEDPESIRHPKKEITRRYNGGGDLSRQQAEDIAQHPDFSADAIRDVCRSFEHFTQDVHVLLKTRD